MGSWMLKRIVRLRKRRLCLVPFREQGRVCPPVDAECRVIPQDTPVVFSGVFGGETVEDICHLAEYVKPVGKARRYIKLMMVFV